MEYPVSFVQNLTDEVKKLEWIAKSHHDTIVRVRKLKDKIYDMPETEFGKYWLMDELEAALDGEKLSENRNRNV